MVKAVKQQTSLWQNTRFLGPPIPIPAPPPPAAAASHTSRAAIDAENTGATTQPMLPAMLCALNA